MNRTVPEISAHFCAEHIDLRLLPAQESGEQSQRKPFEPIRNIHQVPFTQGLLVVTLRPRVCWPDEHLLLDIDKPHIFQPLLEELATVNWTAGYLRCLNQ